MSDLNVAARALLSRLQERDGADPQLGWERIAMFLSGGSYAGGRMDDDIEEYTAKERTAARRQAFEECERIAETQPATRVLPRGQYVGFMRDDSDVILCSHPADVEPMPTGATP